MRLSSAGFTDPWGGERRQAGGEAGEALGGCEWGRAVSSLLREVKCMAVICCRDGRVVRVLAILRLRRLTGTGCLIPVVAAVAVVVAAAVSDGAVAVTVFRDNFVFLLKLYWNITVEIMLGNVRPRENGGPYN